MPREQYRTTIKASPSAVWNVLWDLPSYEEWTSPFSPGSTVKTDWKKGSRALFLGGNGDGMVAEIADVVPEKFMSIRHMGEWKNGVEDTTSDHVKEWQGSMENYTLEKNGDATELIIDIDVNDKWLDFFRKTWPAALDKVKHLAEKN